MKAITQAAVALGMTRPANFVKSECKPLDFLDANPDEGIRDGVAVELGQDLWVEEHVFAKASVNQRHQQTRAARRDVEKTLSQNGQSPAGD